MKEGEVAYTYDGLGQLANKVYGSDSIAVESNSYNIQGWLTRRSNDLFEMKLRYYNPLKGTLPSYTGNIAEWEWLHKGISAENTINTYAFTYDGRGMLKDTEHYTGSSTVPDGLFTERGIVYDRHGNILKLKRHGASAQLVDDFTYGYSGNQLISLKTADNPGGYSYGYDTNGNMTSDGHNALNLNYNYLNLTSTVADTTDNILASYRWLADGTKAGVKNAVGTAGYEYIGSLVYQRNALDELSLESGSFGGGRFSVSESGSGRVYTPNYYLTDHLGSTRAIVDGNGSLLEFNNYYPYGSIWEGEYPKTGNRYLYNGKESQEVFGLGWLDYGSRMYDSDLGRWLTPDPLHQFFSDYLYCGNNPVNSIDPDGEYAIPIPIPLIMVAGFATAATIMATQQANGTNGISLKAIRDGIRDGVRELFSKKTSPEYEHQGKRDREAKEGLDKAQAEIQESINNNFGPPDPDGSKKPNKDANAGPVEKVVAGAAIGGVVTQSVSDTNLNEKPDDGVPSLKPEETLPDKPAEPTKPTKPEDKNRYTPLWETKK